MNKTHDSKALAVFVVLSGENKGKQIPIEEGDNLVGRWDPDTGSFPEVDLSNDDPDVKVSRKHATIECEEGKVVIQDIGSLNGTFVNRGERLVEGQKIELKAGDEVIVGKTVLRFDLLGK